jgi:flagella basal body P-ring formation protein FlgA
MITLLALAVLPAGSCVAVANSRIYARDLADSTPAASAMPPGEFLGYAPAPGFRRQLRLPDNGGSVCIERPMRTLTTEEVAAAIGQHDGIEIEVADHSRYPVPMGRLEFPSAAVARIGSGDLTLLRGRVAYEPNRHFPVWAKVRIRRTATCVVLNEPVRAGASIHETQLRAGAECRGRQLEPVIRNSQEATGKLAKRWLAAGTVLTPAMLGGPPEVERGQTIEIEAAFPSVRFRLPVRAESSGRIGEHIVVRNPESGRKFRAKVTGPGKAVVTEGGTK